MPWKNGGGTTTEIAVHPPGAGIDAFIWRLSTARVTRDGPFSMFPGIDRSLAVVSGQGLDLVLGDRRVWIGQDGEPIRFPGDQPTEARLSGGPIEDLNVMTRRGMARHRLRRMVVSGASHARVEGDPVLLFCGDGRLALDGATLEARDTMVLPAATRDLAVEGRGVLFIVEVEEMPA